MPAGGWTRVFASLLDCPAMAGMQDTYAMAAEQMMSGLATIKTMDASTRKQMADSYGSACQQGADAMKQAAVAMGCKAPSGGTGGTAIAAPPPDDPPDPPPDDVRKDGPYNLRIAGFVALKLHPEDRMGEIYMIAVDPDFQRRGVAARLTSHSLDWFRQAGMSIAMVETGGDPGHAPARRTYEASGFRLLPVARYFKGL